MTTREAQEVHLRPISFEDVPKEAIVSGIDNATGQPRNFVAVNSHTVFLGQNDPEFCRVLAGSFRFCDGFGVHLLCVAQGLARPRYRSTPTDFMWDVFAGLAEKGKTTFLLGDEPGVAEKFAELLNARYPGLVTGFHHGFFAAGSSDEVNVLAEIRQRNPHLLCVGMGQPRQEKWAFAQRSEIACPAVLHLGASMAFAIGARRRGPAWATDHGLEWAFRVMHEPRRMFARYFVEIPRMIVFSLRNREVPRR